MKNVIRTPNTGTLQAILGFDKWCNASIACKQIGPVELNLLITTGNNKNKFLF
ncbi:CreA family protein [Candidatus Ishikawella capsulata]|uniref:hypothetical protein n=1 Tax=Candidatus Ishikawella capsulata TaxID=168169 RepID=UPI00130EDF9D|nr:hypothetical protein [Candidatus Ishikawaella capsulata]